MEKKKINIKDFLITNNTDTVYRVRGDVKHIPAAGQLNEYLPSAVRPDPRGAWHAVRYPDGGH